MFLGVLAKLLTRIIR